MKWINRTLKAALLIPLSFVASCSSESSTTIKNMRQNDQTQDEQNKGSISDVPGKRPVILELSDGSGTVFTAPESPPQRAVLLGEEFSLLGNEAQRFNNSGELVGRMGITAELASVLGLSDSTIFALKSDLAWAISAKGVTAVLGRDPSILTENRKTLSAPLPELAENQTRTLIGISDVNLIYLESDSLLVVTLMNGKLTASSTTLPTVAQDERIIAAGFYQGMLWLASSRRLFALNDLEWTERTLEWHGTDTKDVAFAALAFSGATFPEWTAEAGIVIDAQGLKFTKHLRSTFKIPGGTSNNASSGSVGDKITWISDIRILSDLYCVQCHTWADQEVEWIKRLSDIRQRTLPLAVNEAKTMPQLNSVPAEKITDDERETIIKWLDLKKAGG